MHVFPQETRFVVQAGGLEPNLQPPCEKNDPIRNIHPRLRHPGPSVQPWPKSNKRLCLSTAQLSIAWPAVPGKHTHPYTHPYTHTHTSSQYKPFHFEVHLHTCNKRLHTSSLSYYFVKLPIFLSSCPHMTPSLRLFFSFGSLKSSGNALTPPAQSAVPFSEGLIVCFKVPPVV